MNAPSVYSWDSKKQMWSLFLATARSGPSTTLMNFAEENIAERLIFQVYVKNISLKSTFPVLDKIQDVK